MKSFPLLSACGVFVATILVSGAKSDQTGDESDHKIVFPGSAKDIQNRGDSVEKVHDRGIVTLLEIDRKDLAGFVAQLKIEDRKKPAKERGDPLKNGWNVWPQNAKTFVPGNEVYGHFKKTWDSDALPEEMLSCRSPAGDWLHVEIWKLAGETVLLKLYTDWN